MTGATQQSRAAGRAALAASLALMFAGVASIAGAMTQPPRTFPKPVGRIVDEAAVVPPDTRARIEPKLADLEAKTGIRLVVATLGSLSGDEIEDYAKDLFRFWKLDDAKDDKAVLLVVAPRERKVHIEVGAGLAATMPDIVSYRVIAKTIVPRFDTKDFGGGIEAGVGEIIETLTSDAGLWAKRPPPARSSWFGVLAVIAFMGVVSAAFVYLRRKIGSK